MQQLQCDPSMESRVPRDEHFAETALPDRREERQRVPGRRRRRAVVVVARCSMRSGYVGDRPQLIDEAAVDRGRVGDAAASQSMALPSAMRAAIRTALSLGSRCISSARRTSARVTAIARGVRDGLPRFAASSS